MESGLKQLEITPLIDCVFLLLVFFMLTSHFIIVPGINVKLPKAVSSDSVDIRTETVVITSEDILYSGDKPLSVKEFEKHLEEGIPESVFIKADKDASLGVVVEVWDICKRLNIKKIGIATTTGE